MRHVTVKRVSQPSKGWGKIVVSEQLEIEGVSPYIRKIVKVKPNEVNHAYSRSSI